MRLQLIAAAVAVCAVTFAARADGTLSMRGVYYKERATRVTQPMLDGAFEVGPKGLLTAHLLVDSITSASASSGAADAVAFNEKRYEVGAGYARQVLPTLRIGANGKYSTESDYTSSYIGARAELELAQKNLVLGVGGGITEDEISAGAAQGPAVPTLACEPGQSLPSCTLSTYSLFLSASQILSKNDVLGLSYDMSALRGFTSNPYRLAIAGNQFLPEHHPEERLRQAAAISLRHYIPRSATAVIAAYRHYRDDWDVRAHTPEVRVVQQIGDDAEAALRYRFHTQTAAYFYRGRYADTMGIDGFVSDDVKLSAFRSHTIEAKLGVLGRMFGLENRWAGARFEGILQYVLQDNRFGNAIVAHLALTLPFEY
ncbi:MAG: DUF3570 domain-containing protein [Deltaproteobacteria bacterium]|nr:DUF3570 domain-containing protein [Deltaproteobacteria bacterium]MCW5808746.1 DUF3570 domain-containing protein [Deltaproteobacteria bacterium]